MKGQNSSSVKPRGNSSANNFGKQPNKPKHNQEALVDDNDDNYDPDAGYLSPQTGEGLEDKNEITGMGNSKFKPRKGKIS